MILAIYGAGGSGETIMEIFEPINKKNNFWDEMIFIDDVVVGDHIFGKRVFSYFDFKKIFSQNDDVEIVISLGTPKDRDEIFEMIDGDGYKFATLIHPEAVVSKSVTLGKGVVIGNSTVLSETEIGDNTLIEMNCVIGHHVTIKKNSIISPFVFIGGHVIINENVFIGANVSIKDRVTIGANSVLAMGSCVLESVQDSCATFGNPARTIRRNEDQELF